MRRSAFALIGGACMLLSACGSGPEFVGRPDLQFVGQQAMPAPTREDLLIPDRPYVIGPSDKVSINVFGIPELSQSVQVDTTGTIALPIAGSIHASGMSVEELTREITTRLGSYVRDPRVTINLLDAASQTFSVDGQVAAPGIYPIVGRMSLMRAIARAESTTEFAKEDFVVVYRTSGGQQYAALYDLRAIRAGMYEDPEIYSNDVIYVGESRARRVFKDVLSASGLITAPIIAVLRR